MICESEDARWRQFQIQKRDGLVEELRLEQLGSAVEFVFNYNL